jgi:hypothetical protein
VNKESTSDVRVSFRSTLPRLQKLHALAKKLGWINAWGKPNISAVLNHVIDQHRASQKKEKPRGR